MHCSGGRAGNKAAIATLPTWFIPIGQFHITSPPYETAPDWCDWRGSRFDEYLVDVPEERGTSSTGHRSSGSYQVVFKSKQLRPEHIDKWWCDGIRQLVIRVGKHGVGEKALLKQKHAKKLQARRPPQPASRTISGSTPPWRRNATRPLWRWATTSGGEVGLDRYGDGPGDRSRGPVRQPWAPSWCG